MNVDRRSQAYRAYTSSSFDEDDSDDDYEDYYAPRNSSYVEDYWSPMSKNEYEDVDYYERSQENSYMHPQWNSNQPEYNYQGEEFYEESNEYQSQHKWQGSQYMHDERPSQEDSSLASMIAQLVVQQQKDHQLLMQKMDELQAHNEMLETQIAQQATLNDLEHEFLNQEGSSASFSSLMVVDEDEDENASKKAEVEAEESNLSSNFVGELHSQPNGNFIESIIKTDTEYAKERFQKDEEGIESTLQENEPEEVPEDLTGLSASKASDDKINDLVSRDVYEESQQKDVDEPNVELQEEETSNNEVSNILCHSTSSETWPPYRYSENSFPKEVSDRGTGGSPEVLNSSDLEEQGASMLVVYNDMKCPKSHVMDQLIHISNSPYENCTDFSEPFDDSLSELDNGVQILESDSDTKEYRGILESADESFQGLLKEEAQYMNNSQSCRALFIGGLKRDSVDINTLTVHFKAIPNCTVWRPLMHRAPSKSKKLKVRRNDHGAKEGVSDRRSHKRRYNSDDDLVQREKALRHKLVQKENIRDQIEKRGDPSRSPFKDILEEGLRLLCTPFEKGSSHRTSQVCF